MSDTDDLMGSCQNTQLLRYFPCGSAADTGIDLIKDQCINGIFPCQYRFDRQHHPGQFTATGHLVQRFQTFSGIGGNQEFHIIIAFCCNGLTGSDCDVKFHRQEIETYQRIFQFLRQYRCIFSADLRQFFTGFLQ